MGKGVNYMKKLKIVLIVIAFLCAYMLRVSVKESIEISSAVTFI